MKIPGFKPHDQRSSCKKYNFKDQYAIETPKRIYGQRTAYTEKVLSEQLGERYAEYRKDWIRVSKRDLVSKFPLYIQIEHTGNCNLRCPFCIKGIDELRENYNRGFRPMDMVTYRKILDEAKRYKCPSISFHNNDEPLLLKDLAGRIRLAKEANFIDIILTTNATLLDEKRTCELLNIGITKINFSVDAYSEEGYRKTRIGGNFKTVLKNINYFLKQKKNMGLKLPVTRATCVLTRHNINKMDKFRMFWIKKVDVVEFQNFQAIKGFTENLRPFIAKVDKNFTCNAPWQQVVIRANGDILPCCSFYGADMVLGNIAVSSIYDTWNGYKMRNIREELLCNNFDFSHVCKKCSRTFYTLIENGNHG